MGWHEHHDDVPLGCEMFFRPGYIANLVPSWIPALDGVEAKLAAGARVADVGCGLGASTVLLAQAYPEVDLHRLRLPRRVDRAGPQARRRRRRRGPDDVRGRERAGLPGPRLDLVATFDCLHDMGDPVGAARHVREALAPDGTWLIVEPYAADTVAGEPQPVGRVYYGFSTFLCVPNALSQDGRVRARRAGRRGRDPARSSPRPGFTRFRRAAETPFNIVFEARP